MPSVRAGRAGPRDASTTRFSRRPVEHTEDAAVARPRAGRAAAPPPPGTARRRITPGSRRTSRRARRRRSAGRTTPSGRSAAPRRTAIRVISSTASIEKLPTTSSEPPSAMPVTDIATRAGWRWSVRRMIRAGCDSRRRRPTRSGQLSPKRAGGSGRIASAGGSATARRTAPSAPSTAAAEPIATPSTATLHVQPVEQHREVEEQRVQLRRSPSRTRRRARTPATDPSAATTRLHFT